MQTRYDLLLEMSGFVDKLLENAKSLNEAAHHALAEEELVRLQRRQEEIISQIEGLNRLLKEKKLTDDTRAGPLQKELQRKLIKFQERNRNFVKLVQDRHRIIQQKTLPAEILRDLEVL